jgi:Flp pilus assembly protein TadG
MIVTRKRAAGSSIVQFFGFIIIALMISGLAIDFGYYYASQNQMQTAATAAALAATTELYNSTEDDPDARMADAISEAQNIAAENLNGTVLDDDDVVFGFIDPETKVYNSSSFASPTDDPDYETTGGYNAAWVRVRYATGSSNGPIRTIMANMLGIANMNTQATAVGLIDQNITSITDGGLRPIYVCEAQFNRAMQDGNANNNIVRIYGDHTEVDGVATDSGCPELSSGNWSFADFTDCSNGTVGASTIGEWFANGYPGAVNTGQCYSTKPGNFISSISGELDTLITNQTTFPVPLYNDWSSGAGSGGSNGQVDVSGFAGFQITSYQANGAQSDRYIEGRFTRYICNVGCGSDGSGTAPGGSVVKLRLAGLH